MIRESSLYSGGSAGDKPSAQYMHQKKINQKKKKIILGSKVMLTSRKQHANLDDMELDRGIPKSHSRTNRSERSDCCRAELGRSDEEMSRQVNNSEYLPCHIVVRSGKNNVGDSVGESGGGRGSRHTYVPGG